MEAACSAQRVTVGEGDAAITFEIAVRKSEVRVARASRGTILFDVQCPGGIGAASFTLCRGAWPGALVIRLHLRGLESLTICDGATSLAASVSSHGTPTVRIRRVEGDTEEEIGRGGPMGVQITAVDAGGKPACKIPLENGYFEVVVPKAFLAGRTKTIRVQWIDFFRR